MAAPKLCTDCAAEPKRAGHPKWCTECWLKRQPVETQIKWAQQRAAAVPEPARRGRVPERDWPEGRRWCSGCQSFTRLRDMPKGASRCKGCSSDTARDSYLERTYGISRDEERAILAAQGGRCALCGREVHSKRMAVDHDHVTGKVRGLLCPGDRWCNSAVVGGIEAASQHTDGPLAYALRLVAYFQRPPAQQVLEDMRGEY